jgi:hypothetical protein
VVQLVSTLGSAVLAGVLVGFVCGVFLEWHHLAGEPTRSTLSPSLCLTRAGAAQAAASGDSLVDRICVPAYDGWDGLTLEYRVAWPLGLLLTPAVLRRYRSDHHPPVLVCEQALLGTSNASA